MTWYPHVTVASVVVKEDKFLMVYERSEGKNVYNQPAGHLEKNETLLQAATRETLEETGWETQLKYFLGISQYTSPENGVTYLRHSFVAEPIKHHPNKELDKEIIEIKWMSYEELCSNTLLRSPLVLTDIKKFLQGIHYPLSIISSVAPQELSNQ